MGRRASHVRFSTPAAPAYVPKATPSQTKGVNSCNAGMLQIFICQRACSPHWQATVSALPPNTATSLHEQLSTSIEPLPDFVTSAMMSYRLYGPSSLTSFDRTSPGLQDRHAHAGSTPFFSGGRRPGPDLGDGDDDVPVGSPSTVARKLLQPVLLDTIQTLRTRSALGPGRQLPLDAGTPGQAWAPGAGARGPTYGFGALIGAGASGSRGAESQAEEKAPAARQAEDAAAGPGADSKAIATEGEASKQGANQQQGR